jgi:two-component sensor histidine kinase
MTRVICQRMPLALSTNKQKDFKFLNFLIFCKPGKLLCLIFLMGTTLFPYVVKGQNRNNPNSSTLDWIAERINNARDTAQVFSKLHESLQLFQEEKAKAKLAQTHKYMATWHNLYGKMDSAVYYLQLTIPFYEDSQQKDTLAQTYLQLSDYLSSKADYAEAMNVVFEALEIYQETDNQRGMALCYTSLCDLLYSQYKFEEGNEYCDMAIAIQTQLNVPEDLAITYRRKSANLLFIDGETEHALRVINQAIDIYDEMGETGLLYMACINWRGNILKYLDRFDEALDDYQSNLKKSEEMGLTRYSLVSLANIGHVYTMQEQYEQAIPYTLQAIEIMERTGNTKNLWENYMHVANSYEKLGQFEQALKYNKLHAEAYADFLRSSTERLESELLVKYETEKKQETISRQEAQIAQQRIVQILYISIAGILIISLMGMFISMHSIRKKRKALQTLNQQLDAKNRQNELLMKEIHHRVKNNLEMVKSLIALQCAQMEDSTSKDAMLESQNRVQSMGIIHQKLYQGENLGSIEMKDYFVNLSEGILDAFNADDKIKIECAMENLELDIDTAVPIGLIVNELLTNSLKYAFPERAHGMVQISLSQPDPSILTLTVSDNGVGKIKGQKPLGTGFGSQLIDLLTRQLNGEMTEISETGTSTKFRFRITKAA